MTGPTASRYDLGRWLVGQDAACRRLELMLAADHLPTLLLVGQQGTGKRTLALRIAQAANCRAQTRPCGECRTCRTIAAMNHPDVKLIFPLQLPARQQSSPETVAGLLMNRYAEYRLDRVQPARDARHHVLTDAVRWIRTELTKPPAQARRRFVIVLGAEQMNANAANAFLKTLEEPQSQTTIILTTDRAATLLATVRSRCRAVRLADVQAAALARWLTQRAEATSEQVSAAVAVGAGSPGRALRYLEEPETLISDDIAQYFAGQTTGGDTAAIDLARRLEDTPVALAVSTLLFLHRETLRAALGIPSDYAVRNPAVSARASAETPDRLRRAVKYLLERHSDTRISLNRLLSEYTLLVALRPPQERGRKAGRE